MYKISTTARTKEEEKYILYGLIAIICLAPLPLGSNRPIPLAVINIFIGILSIYWGVFASKNRAFVRVSIGYIKIPAILTTCVLLWAIFQAMAFNIPAIANDFWKPAQGNIKSSISISPRESWIDIYKILAYSVIFWLTLQIARSTKNAQKIFLAISFSGAVYAIYGLMVMALGSEKVLWFDKPMYLYSLTSTFINRNNYATYAGITLIISIAVFLNKLFENTNHLKGREFYKHIIRNIFTSALLPLGIVFIILSALVRTDSRAGIVSSALGVLVFISLSIFTGNMKKHRNILAAISILIMAVVSLVFIAGGVETIERFSQIGNDTQIRAKIYGITLKAIADFPLTGTGLGGFTDIFSAYRDDSLGVEFNSIVDHAHNSYLELMLELGIPAAIMVIAAMFIIWMKCLSGVRERKQNNYIPAIAVSTAILVATHALFDFSAQIPAVALIFIVLLAIGIAQSWSRKVDISDAGDDIIIRPLYYCIATKASIALGIILVFGGAWQSYLYFAKNDAYDFKENAIAKIELARTQGVLTDKGIELLKDAEKDLQESIRQKPVNAYGWAYLAYVRLLNGEDRQEVSRLLAASISNGFYEPRLLFLRIKLIPIVWASASEDEKTIFANQIKQAWQWDNKKTMQVMGAPLAKSILLEQLLTMPEAKQHIEKFKVLEVGVKT